MGSTTTSRLALVTGAAGFFGRHVARRLSSEGWRVVGLGRGGVLQSAQDRWGLVDFFHDDVSLDSLVRVQQRHGAPELVCHAAGGASVGQSWLDPVASFKNTVGSTAVVVEFLRLAAPNALLIYPSSAAVYGIGEGRPFAEDCSGEPVSPYGTHKMLAERLCIDAARQFGIRGRVVRFFSLFGPQLRKQLLWDIAARLARGERTLSLDGDGSETRDFLYVEDAARLIALVASVDGDLLVVNGASGVPTTVRQAADTLIREMNLGDAVELVFTGRRRQGDAPHHIAQMDRLQRIGFIPKWSFDAGVERFVAWVSDEIRRSDLVLDGAKGGHSA